MAVIATDRGYDPIALAAATEKVVVDGNQRKYVQLGRTLRFYGGTTSATEVDCNLRCKFCFSDKPVWKPKQTGRFYTPQQVFDGLATNARKYGHTSISASASEGTLGRQHLHELLELVDESQPLYILETNGMTLGDDKEFAESLAKYKNLHVRVSIKGCNACVSVSFSNAAEIKSVEKKLETMHPGILKSLELERIKLFPKVQRRIQNEGLVANKGISCIEA